MAGVISSDTFDLYGILNRWIDIDVFVCDPWLVRGAFDLCLF